MKTSSLILAELREVPTHEGVYELLAEIFFEYLMHELGTDPPCPEQIRKIRNLHYDIYKLLALAREAKKI